MQSYHITSKPSTDIVNILQDELLELKEKTGDSALSYAIKAQLVVINSIYSANSMLSSVDLL